MKKFKIKVGIDEFIIKESDMPRVVEAMRTNNMVALACGVFRGSAILAVYEDIGHDRLDKPVRVLKFK